MVSSPARRGQSLEYVDLVVSGKKRVPHYVRQAVKRHVEDLKKAKSATFPYRYDPAKAHRVIDFIEELVFASGTQARKRFKLEAWQVFALSMIFGWVHKSTGFRRFQQAYIGVPRKNGKTTLSAAVGLYMIVADDEPAGRAYTVASKKEQAQLSFREMKDIIDATPELDEYITVQYSELVCKETRSTLGCLASDSKTLDGLNPSFILFDEFHTQDSERLYSVLRNAFGARFQPLMIMITTAGFNTQGFAYEHEMYVKAVLDGRVENDSTFGMIYCTDPDDDPHSPATWEKVNPNYGVSLLPHMFKSAYDESKAHPQKWTEFLTKKLNIWTTAADAFLAPLVVQKVFKPLDEGKYHGRKAYLALDLSVARDLTGYSITPEALPGEKPVTFFRSFIPESTLEQRTQKESINFRSWVDEGWVTVCPGETITHQIVLDQIYEDAKNFQIVEVAYDVFNADLIVKDLEDNGFETVKFPQSVKEFSPPTKYLERMIYEEGAEFQNSPIAFWCFTNAELYQNDYGIKPKKPKNKNQRIDLLICAIMSLWRCVAHAKEERSVYEDREVRFI